MTVFRQPGDRVIALPSSGNLAGTSSVIGLLNWLNDANATTGGLLATRMAFDVARLITDDGDDIQSANSPHPRR